MTDRITAKIMNTDYHNAITSINDNSLDAVITDPPYFLDSMGVGDDWNNDELANMRTKKQVVSSLKGGMKFDKQQGIDFQNAMHELALLALPKLKPGGWFIAFSAPRLYHRLAVGVEDAGYEIRDMMEWLYTKNQMKAMGLQRQLNADANIDDSKRTALHYELESWKTPQMKSCFEPIVIAQKPREGTYYDNWVNHHIGLINVRTNVGDNCNQATANVITTAHINSVIDHAFLVSKPSKSERAGMKHPSMKPIALMQHIIDVFIPTGGLIFDPFLGSGTTCLAALNAGVNSIGSELSGDYYKDSLERASVLGYSVHSNGDNTAVIMKPVSLFD